MTRKVQRRRKVTTMKNEVQAIDPAVASDVDGDGKLDLDPAKAEQTITDLVILDHRLRDEGSSLAQILTILAHTSQGIRV